MKYTVSLKNNYDFRRLYSKGRHAGTALVVVYCRKTQRDYNRLGITVSPKLGKAVHRNRFKRRVREIFRLNMAELGKGYDYIVVCRHEGIDADYSSLEKNIITLVKKLQAAL